MNNDDLIKRLRKAREFSKHRKRTWKLKMRN